MILATSKALPVGERWQMPKYGRGTGNRPKMVIRDAVRGDYNGPIMIVREVTLDDYCAWCEEDTGHTMPRRERWVLAHHKFYEIALD